MGTNQPWNRRLNVLKSRWPWSDHLMISFKTTVRADCAAFACSPLPLSIKALAPWLSGRGVGLWTGICPRPRLPASKIKQTFLSTNLASLLAFERPAAGPHFRLHFCQPTWSLAMNTSASEQPYVEGTVFFVFFLFFVFFKFYLFIYLFIYFWLCWVFGSCEGFL